MRFHTYALLIIILIFFQFCQKPKEKGSFLFPLQSIPLGNNTVASDLPQFAYQINNSMLYNFSPLFTGQPGKIDLKLITDIAVVDFDQEKVSTSIPFNIMILDGISGGILYKKAFTTWSFYKHSEIKDAKKIAVLPNGKIAFITKTGSLNLCFEYTNDTINNNPGCSLIDGDYIHISASKYGLFIAEQNVVALYNIDTNEMVRSNDSYQGITAIHAGRNGLVVVDKYGKRLNYVNWLVDLTIFKSKENIQFSYSNGLQTPIVHIGSISQTPNGNYYIAEHSFGVLGLLDSNFNPLGFWKMPSLPLPLKRLDSVRSVAISNISGKLYVNSKNSMNIYQLMNNGFLTGSNPIEESPNFLKDIEYEIMANPRQYMQVLIDDPKADLSKQPELKAIIDQRLNEVNNG